MALDIHNQRPGLATADKVTLSSLVRAASSTSIRARIAIRSGRSTSETWPMPIADSIDDDEREWDSIVSKPHVQQALRRMATEARRQYYAGETEEGGFAVE